MSSSSSHSPWEFCSKTTKTMLNVSSHTFSKYYNFIIEHRYVSVLKTVFSLTHKALLNNLGQINKGLFHINYVKFVKP